jgi:hypothetical protein
MLNMQIGGSKDLVIRSRLRVWLWLEYCKAGGMPINTMRGKRSPAIMVADFMFYMCLEGASDPGREEVMATVHELFGALGFEAKMAENVWLNSVSGGFSTEITKKSDFRDVGSGHTTGLSQR